MAKLLFGSFMKILVWLVIIGTLVAGFDQPAWLLLTLILIIAGPCVAIPAMVAVHGKVVVSAKNMAILKRAVSGVFADKKSGKSWITRSEGHGDMNYELTNTKVGCEPTVSVAFETTEDGQTAAHVWMSEWTSGGLNGGKGTPFWVWGGSRALGKVNEVAAALRQLNPAPPNPDAFDAMAP